MALIQLSEARRLATERLRTIFDAALPAEIIASAAVDGRGIECPAPTAVFLQLEIDYSTIARDHSVFMVVAPDGPRRRVQDHTGGTESHKSVTEQEVAVALVYSYRPQTLATTPGGRPMTPDEVMLRRADIYMSAIINTIQKYACEPSSIHDIVFINDIPSLVTNDQFPIKGIAQVNYTITQHCGIPNRRPLP